jgi:hypothetical protein
MKVTLSLSVSLSSPSIAIIAFGIKDDSFALATGFTVGIWGIIVIAVHMKVSGHIFNSATLHSFHTSVSAYFVPISQWPNYFDKKEKYVPQVNH